VKFNEEKIKEICPNENPRIIEILQNRVKNLRSCTVFVLDGMTKTIDASALPEACITQLSRNTITTAPVPNPWAPRDTL
jgi:hypothetical protein